MNDLFNYPAYHRSDVNGGGGIYQVLEYNGDLYVVICTGTPNNKNEANRYTSDICYCQRYLQR